MPLPLVERSDDELERMIRRKVKGVSGVKSCRWVTVDTAGRRPTVVVNVWLDPSADYVETHRVTSKVEAEVKEVLQDSQVYIRTEPAGDDKDAIWSLVKATAESVPGSRGAHNIHMRKVDKGIGVDLHLELSADMTVKEAYDVTRRVEAKLKSAAPFIKEVFIHEESVSDQLQSEASGAGTEIRWYLEHVARRYPEIRAVKAYNIRRSGDKVYVSLSCEFDSDSTLQKTDEVVSKYKAEVQRGLPEITRIDIHREPVKDKAAKPH